MKGAPQQSPEPIVGASAWAQANTPPSAHAGTDRSSAYEYGRLAISSLITTCAGALVALLAFLGQEKRLDPSSATFALAGVGLIAAALWFALVSAIFAYFNQYFVAFERERLWLFYVALAAGVLALLLLSVGGFVALSAVATILVFAGP